LQDALKANKLTCYDETIDLAVAEIVRLSIGNQ
jgi:hypothetical protein